MQSWMSHQLARIDLPVKLLRFPLGRLQGGEVRGLELSKNRCELTIKFASGPAVSLVFQAQGYQPIHQVLWLRIEQLVFSGFRGAPVLNLVPGKVLEIVAAQANQRLPGFLELGGNMEVNFHLEPLLHKALQEAPFRQSIQTIGLDAKPHAQIENLELLENQLLVVLSASG